IAEVVAGIAQPESDRPAADGALGRGTAGDHLLGRLLRPGPQDRGQPAVPGDGGHDRAVGAARQPPEGAVEVGLARAIGAGDYVEATELEGQVTDRAVALNCDGADHTAHPVTAS